MSDRWMQEMHAALAVKAIRDGIDELIEMAGKDAVGYRIVQNEIISLTAATKDFTRLMDLLFTKPNLTVVK